MGRNFISDLHAALVIRFTQEPTTTYYGALRFACKEEEWPIFACRLAENIRKDRPPSWDSDPKHFWQSISQYCFAVLVCDFD